MAKHQPSQLCYQKLDHLVSNIEKGHSSFEAVTAAGDRVVMFYRQQAITLPQCEELCDRLTEVLDCGNYMF